MRVVDWYLGLRLGQKIVVGLVVAAGLFLASYFTTLALLSSSAPEEGSSQAGASATPGITYPEASSATPLPEPAGELKITSARWEGEKAVVEGSWKGDISSVHCDLLEGGATGRATDWWDREVPAKMTWSERTFTQNFIEAKDRKIEDPIEQTSSYAVLCSAQFTGGWQINDSARVEGTPPAEG